MSSLSFLRLLLILFGCCALEIQAFAPHWPSRVVPSAWSRSKIETPYVLHASSKNQTAAQPKPLSQQERWNKRIEELHEYNRTFGTFNVASTHVFKKTKWASTAKWLDQARKKQSTLPKERKDQLLALNISLNGNELREERHEQQWNEMYSRLLDYNKTHGDMRVPNDYSEDPKLGNWVRRQKYLWKDGELKPHRLEKLQSINFEFQIRSSKEKDMTKLDQNWLEMLANLTDFHEKHGHFWPPRRYSNATVTKLHTWASTQRQLKRKGRLRKDRMLALDEIGFPWDCKEEQDARWFAQFHNLKEHLEEWERGGKNGSPYGPSYLGNLTYEWTRKQRWLMGKGTLDPKRKKFLDDIGFDWAYGSDQ